MIQPVRRAELTAGPKVLRVITPGEARQLGSSITSLRPQPVEYKKRILDLLTKAWEFIKTYFLSFCFGPEERDRIKLSKQIGTFIKIYYEAAKKDLENEEVHVVREFGNLSKSIRQDVEQEIVKICKSAFPNRSKDFYEQKSTEHLNAPFKVIEQGEGQREIQVFAVAILAVKERYASPADEA